MGILEEARRAVSRHRATINRALAAWCQDNGVSLLFETRAKTSYNLEHAFGALTREVVRRKDALEREQRVFLTKQQQGGVLPRARLPPALSMDVKADSRQGDETKRCCM